MDQALELAVVREALQTRLLVELMSNAMHKELVLKGGMAMRAVHGSVRFTKDIDLDADLKYSRGRVHGIVRRSIDRAVASGLIDKATVTEPKQAETTLRWKIVGVQPGSEAPVNLTVEVSRRAMFLHGHIVEMPLHPAHKAGNGVMVQVLDSQAIAVTKVLALTDPNRMAPRDLYDLHVLIQANVEEPAVLLAAMPNAGDRLPQAMAELWPKIESMSYEQFRADVVPYLPPNVAAAVNENAFDDMRLAVGTNVEKWLQAASEAATLPSTQSGLMAGASSASIAFQEQTLAGKPPTEKP